MALTLAEAQEQLTKLKLRIDEAERAISVRDGDFQKNMDSLTVFYAREKDLEAQIAAFSGTFRVTRPAFPSKS